MSSKNKNSEYELIQNKKKDEFIYNRHRVELYESSDKQKVINKNIDYVDPFEQYGYKAINYTVEEKQDFLKSKEMYFGKAGKFSNSPYLLQNKAYEQEKKILDTERMSIDELFTKKKKQNIKDPFWSINDKFEKFLKVHSYIREVMIYFNPILNGNPIFKNLDLFKADVKAAGLFLQKEIFDDKKKEIMLYSRFCEIDSIQEVELDYIDEMNKL